MPALSFLIARRLPAFLVPALAISSGFGCSPEPSLESDPATRDGGSGTDAAAPSAPVCETERFPDDSALLPFDRLTARVVDTEGAAVGDLTAQACGVNLCLFGDTDASGNVTHSGPQDLQRVAFKYGDGLRYAQLALLLPAEREHDLGDQITMAFPDVTAGQAFQAGETLRSSGVELVIEPGSKVDVDVLTFNDESEHVFLAAEFPRDAFPDAVDPGLNFELVFALAPVKTKLCPAAKLRLPNTLAWGSGEEAEVFVHSTDTRAEWAPYGEWGKVSDAEVTDDEAWIETKDGQGIPMLAVIGVRRAP